MREKIVTFLNLTGISKYPDVIAAGLAEQIRCQFAPSGEAVPDAFEKAVSLMSSTLEAKKPVLFDTVIAAYEKSFTEAEMEDLVSFYGSSVGKRVVALGGIVLPEVIEAGNVWGAESLKGIEDELGKLLS